MSHIKYSLFNRYRDARPCAEQGSKEFDQDVCDIIESLNRSIDGLNNARNFHEGRDSTESALSFYLDQVQDMIDTIVEYGETINALEYPHIQLVLALDDLPKCM